MHKKDKRPTSSKRRRHTDLYLHRKMQTLHQREAKFPHGKSSVKTVLTLHREFSSGSGKKVCEASYSTQIKSTSSNKNMLTGGFLTAQITVQRSFTQS